MNQQQEMRGGGLISELNTREYESAKLEVIKLNVDPIVMSGETSDDLSKDNETSMWD